MDRDIFHLPQNGLGATKQPLGGKLLSEALHGLLYLLRGLSRVMLGTARVLFIPVGGIDLVSTQPFVEPTARTAEGLTNGGYGVTRQITGDGQLTTGLLFFSP